MRAQMKPRVSVVIASHRPDYIGACLDSLNAQQGMPGAIEQIVVCDYPPAPLQKTYPAARWHFVNDTSISAKRNAGIRASRAPIIAFIDDDCRADPDWIVRGCAYLGTHADAAGVVGRTRIEHNAASGPAMGQFKRLERRGYRANNVFYRTRAVLDAGMFDERFTVQREDIDLAFTLLEHGWRIDFDDTIQVMHCYRTGEKWDLLKNCWNRRFDPLLYQKHRVRYRRHIRSPFTPGIGAVCFGYAVGTAGMVARTSLWPAYILLALLPPLILTARRVGTGTGAGGLEWFRELSACAVSPFALLAALVYGSLRYRSVLLF
ncbi:MAG: glycosyltransferase [Chitinivibrionales bacterium]|nr:glycosyltransferase [Chitinivibrionales bacterium]MBD3396583.1 glycosyltransferase [Chitinivibrionales bacterium]